MSFIEGIAIGAAFGIFCPAIARKIKSYFTKEAITAQADVAKKI